jgi:hypothetical protein
VCVCVCVTMLGGGIHKVELDTIYPLILGLSLSETIRDDQWVRVRTTVQGGRKDDAKRRRHRRDGLSCLNHPIRVGSGLGL